MSSVVALIVAAGRGHRFGGEMPKQYLKIGRNSVIREAVSSFLDHPRVDGVRVVIHPDDEELYGDAVSGLDLMTPVYGGAERQDSVRKGLESLADNPPDHVLVHDAARPYVSGEMIDRILDSLGSAAGATLGIPVSDTLKRVADGFVEATVDRAGLWRAQTPQGFRYAELLEAHAKTAHLALTDDAAVAEAAGMEVAIVDGDAENVKITSPEDLKPIDTGAAAYETRVGQGFDVHKFGPGNSVVLCGVEIPYEQALDGHSDADVALHSITDAVLGACGAGDIGDHFPPTDPQWRGTASAVFLSRAIELARSMGGELMNVDVTIICEAPKIGPHRNVMRVRVAEILGIEVSRVNVKATTTERLGFTGRGEGIAASSIVSLRVSR